MKNKYNANYTALTEARVRASTIVRQCRKSCLPIVVFKVICRKKCPKYDPSFTQQFLKSPSLISKRKDFWIHESFVTVSFN